MQGFITEDEKLDQMVYLADMFGFLNDMFLLKDTSDVSKIYMKKLGNSR
jgi:hypothetical protein